MTEDIFKTLLSACLSVLPTIIFLEGIFERSGLILIPAGVIIAFWLAGLWYYSEKIEKVFNRKLGKNFLGKKEQIFRYKNIVFVLVSMIPFVGFFLWINWKLLRMISKVNQLCYLFEVIELIDISSWKSLEDLEGFLNQVKNPLENLSEKEKDDFAKVVAVYVREELEKKCSKLDSDFREYVKAIYDMFSCDISELRAKIVKSKTCKKMNEEKKLMMKFVGFISNQIVDERIV